ncbi:hypothetical protein ILYODFUR_016853 [Ilyodon furcidens]|uniref:Uncharacterized protein n=1 Tax=Ilyodon furcidens TaxID=33524 RepID=A0ABV0T8L4_9TELE
MENQRPSNRRGTDALKEILQGEKGNSRGGQQEEQQQWFLSLQWEEMDLRVQAEAWALPSERCSPCLVLWRCTTAIRPSRAGPLGF